MKDQRPEGIEQYDDPRGGWDALKAAAKTLADQLKANQPDGFDLPRCVWPDPKHTSSFEFCESGAKAIIWESTAKRSRPEPFESHTVSGLWTWTDHDLEDAGQMPIAPDGRRAYRPGFGGASHGG